MLLTRAVNDGILTLTMDDGAKNALLPETFTDLAAALNEALDAGDDIRAIVLAGSPTIFTAGLDVKWMMGADHADIGGLLRLMGSTLMRLWGAPWPTVAACAGHTLAAGTMLAMACDHAVAGEGRGKWGLSETRIGFELPMYGIELARGNVASHRVDDLLLPGAMVGPDEAVAVGFADELVAEQDVLSRAHEVAASLAELPASTYAGTKLRLRGAAIERVLTGLDADIDAVMTTTTFGR